MDDLVAPVVTGPAGVIVGGGPVPAPVGTGRNTVAIVAVKRSLIMIDASRSIPPLPATGAAAFWGDGFLIRRTALEINGTYRVDRAGAAATGQRETVVAEAPGDAGSSGSSPQPP